MNLFRCVLFSLVACLLCAGRTGASTATLPEPGSIPWAEAITAAESQCRSSQTPEELLTKCRALIRLYGGCTACQELTYEHLKSRLEGEFQSREFIATIDREELSNAPLQLSRALIESGSPVEARTIALREIDKSSFVEGRLAWIEVLAQIHFQLGQVEQGERLIRRLREETPVSPDYCAKEMKWRSWMDGPSESIGPILNAAELDHALEEIHAHSQSNPVDPKTCCRIDMLIEAAHAFARQFKSRNESAMDRLVSLIPEGLDAAQVALARRTPDPKIRAAILLSRARRALPFERSRALELIHEASVAGPDPSIHMGTRAMELSTLVWAQHQESSHAVALATLAEFPGSSASCEACQLRWYLLWNAPDIPAQLDEWENACRALIDGCPDRMDRWRLIAQFFGPALPMGQQVYERLLAINLSSEVRPTLLLKLSDAIRHEDPARALRLEREAIHHPQYPGIGDTYQSERRLRAEANDDFETALFLDLLAGPPQVTCGNDCFSTPDYTFRTAYDRLRLGLDTERQWKCLIGSLPVGPGDCSAPGFHTAAYFDRVMKAARAARMEKSALKWFRGLEHRYEEEILHPGDGRRNCLCGGTLDVPATGRLLRSYIEDLDSSNRPVERPTPSTSN